MRITLPPRSSTLSSPFGDSARTFEADRRFDSPGPLPVFSGAGASTFGPGWPGVRRWSASTTQAAVSDSNLTRPSSRGTTRLNGHFLAVTFAFVCSERAVATFSWSNAGRIAPEAQSTSFHDSPPFSFQAYARSRPESDQRIFSGRDIWAGQYQASYCFCHSAGRLAWAMAAKGASSRRRSSMPHMMTCRPLTQPRIDYFLGFSDLALGAFGFRPDR